MNVHPFRPRADHPAASGNGPSADIDDSFPFDHHEDFAEFDDADESINRYGSVDRQFRYAHRTVSATLLAALTGIRVTVCQAFHCAFFGLLEDVGDDDGLIATPTLIIVGRRERLNVASGWMDEHPPPDVAALMAAADAEDLTDDVDRRISELIERYSLDLAFAADTNPSLTLGSMTALHDRVIDEILDLLLSCRFDEIERLVTTTIDLLRRMPSSVRPIGGAVFVPVGDELPFLPPMSV